MTRVRGPLSGIKIVEVAGLGPVPFCGMMLGDMGADVVLVERPGASTAGGLCTALERNRRRIVLDLKTPAGVEVLLRLAARSDALVEGYRPGVAERMGWGPEACLGRNLRLVYGRVSGWGREGPLAQAAGHDINYLALSGLLHAVGPPGGAPLPPLNVIGDFGGGGLLLAYGIVCALLEARISGQGQVVDAAMLDGSALFGALLKVLGLDDPEARAAGFPALDPATRETAWPALRARIAAVIRTGSRDHWVCAFAGIDACASPVLSLDEALRHPQVQAHGTFAAVEGRMQPAPAPRFSRTPAAPPEAARPADHDTATVLKELGIGNDEQAMLRRSGAFGGAAS